MGDKTPSYELVYENPNIYMVRVPLSNFGFGYTNSYLVVSGDESLLVDTGTPSEKGESILKEVIEELVPDFSKFSVFLTHLHTDHSGLTGKICTDATKVYVGEEGVRLLFGDGKERFSQHVSEKLIEEGLNAEEVKLTVDSVWYSVTIPKENKGKIQALYDGDEIKVGEFTFIARDTPGHCPGHLVLYEPSAHVIFSGDLILFTMSPTIAVSPDGRDTVQLYFDSLELVRSMEIDKLFHSHGDLQEGHYERIDELVESRKGRLEEAYSIISASPGLFGSEVIKQMSWSSLSNGWEKASYQERAIVLLYGIAMLDYLHIRGRIERRANTAGVFTYFTKA